jgi:glycosyltransferase involved in cell wall biosynthesis
VFEPIVVLPSGGYLADKLRGLGLKMNVIQAPRWIDIRDRATVLYNAFQEMASLKDYTTLIREEGIDIVYTNTITKVAGAVASRLCGVPHVWHIREILKDHPLTSFFSLETTFNLVEHLSDSIIANSNATAAQFQEIAHKSKMHVVHNAIDTSTFMNAPVRKKLRKELALDSCYPLVGIIGSIHKHKNHEDAVRAFAHLKERGIAAKLVIIGEANNIYKEFLMQLIRDLDIKDCVTFLRFRYNISEILQELDLILVPSLAEPFGRTTIEAMAAGKPVVATNAGGSPEIVVDEVTGFLVPPHAPEKMAEAIQRVLSDPKKAAEMGQAGRERVSTVFTELNYISGIEAILNDTHSSCISGRLKTAPVHYKALVSELRDIIKQDFMYVNKEERENNIISSIHKKDPDMSIKMYHEILKQSFEFLTADDFVKLVIDWGKLKKQLDELQKQIQLSNSRRWTITRGLKWAYRKLKP